MRDQGGIQHRRGGQQFASPQNGAHSKRYAINLETQLHRADARQWHILAKRQAEFAVIRLQETQYALAGVVGRDVEVEKLRVVVVQREPRRLLPRVWREIQSRRDSAAMLSQAHADQTLVEKAVERTPSAQSQEAGGAARSSHVASAGSG